MLCPAACDGAPSGPRLREPPRGRFLVSISPSAVLKFYVPFIDPVEGLVIELLGLEISHVAVAAGLNRVQACGLKDRWHVRSGNAQGEAFEAVWQAHAGAQRAVRGDGSRSVGAGSPQQYTMRRKDAFGCSGQLHTRMHAMPSPCFAGCARGYLAKLYRVRTTRAPAPTHAAHSSDAQEAVLVLSR